MRLVKAALRYAWCCLLSGAALSAAVTELLATTTTQLRHVVLPSFIGIDVPGLGMRDGVSAVCHQCI
jgi:hypothetical protein